MKTRVLFGFLAVASSLFSCKTREYKNSDVSGWGDATDKPVPTQTPGTKTCTPWYISTTMINSIVKFNGYCDNENNMHYGFGYADAAVTSKLKIWSTDYPTNTAQLDKIFEYQSDNGVGEELIHLLMGDVTDLLKKGDPESVKKAHQIYLDALLKPSAD